MGGVRERALGSPTHPLAHRGAWRRKTGRGSSAPPLLVPQPPKPEFSRLNTHNGATHRSKCPARTAAPVAGAGQCTGCIWATAGPLHATAGSQEEPTRPSICASQLLQACCWALGVVVVEQGGAVLSPSTDLCSPFDARTSRCNNRTTPGAGPSKAAQKPKITLKTPLEPAKKRWSRTPHLCSPNWSGGTVDICSRRERGAPEGAGLGEEAQFDIPEEIQGNRKCVQERGFRAGRRE